MDKEKKIRSHSDILDLISQFDDKERKKRKVSKEQKGKKEQDNEQALLDEYTEQSVAEDELAALPLFQKLSDRLEVLPEASTIVKEDLSSKCNRKECFLLYNVLSKEHCDLLIKESEAHGFQAAADYCHQYLSRLNDRLMVEDDQWTQWLFSRIQRYLPRTVQDWKLKEVNKRWRLCRYQPGHYFGLHVDSGYTPSTTVKSKLTIMLYLNSSKDGDFEGGTTKFYNHTGTQVTMDIEPEAGMALIFLQEDMDLLHEGTKVEKGKKYILRSDVMYEMEEEDDQFFSEPFSSQWRKK